VIVDTSAVIAVLAAEDDAAIYAHAIADASVRRLSAASYLECGIVLDNQRDPVISRSLDELLAEAEFVIEPVTEQQARLARQAYADFGKGSGHRAGLNFGDCLGYALALDTREPLLERRRFRAYGCCGRARSVGAPDIRWRGEEIEVDVRL
jgi:ribonuclease VapC